MKKIAFIGLIIFLNALAATAQSGNKLVFAVPVDFHFQEQLLPAGAYSIEMLLRESNQPIIVLRTKKGKSIGALRAIPVAPTAALTAEPARISLFRFGNEYFLAQYSNPSENLSFKLIPKKREKLLARNFGAKPDGILSILVSK